MAEWSLHWGSSILWDRAAQSCASRYVRCKQLCSRNDVYISKGEEYGTDIVPASLKIVLIEDEIQKHDVYVCPHRSSLQSLCSTIQGRSSRKSRGEKWD